MEPIPHHNGNIASLPVQPTTTATITSVRKAKDALFAFEIEQQTRKAKVPTAYLLLQKAPVNIRIVMYV